MALGFVSFFTDVSTEMILSILPIFIISIGGTSEIVGLIDGLGDFTNNSLRVVSGTLSDRILRRKPIVFFGYSLSSFAKPIFAIASTWPQALAVRVADRAGKGIRTPPRDALINAYVSKEKTGTAFGLHSTLDQAGAILGPLLTVVLVPFIHFQGLFLASFVPAAIALVLIALFVKEVRVERRGASSLLVDVRGLLHGEFVKILAAVGIFSLGAFSFSFILLRAGNSGLALVAFVYLIINLTEAIIGIPAGALADRIGKERVLLMGYGIFVLTCLLGVLLDYSYVSTLIVGAAWGVYFGMADTVGRAFIPKFSPSNLVGTAYSLYYLIAGSTALLANVIFGALWLIYSPNAAFTYSLIVSIVGATGFALVIRSSSIRRDSKYVIPS